MHEIGVAFQMVFDPYNLWVMFAASLFGLFVGAVPGLTATMATALLVPVTFFMPPIPAIAAIVSATAMAIFAGDIPGCLLRMPGTPASAAYTDEAYAMTRKGQTELALGAGLVFSAIGGLFGTAVLIVSAPTLRPTFALRFSSFRIFLAGVGADTISTAVPNKPPIALNTRPAPSASRSGPCASLRRPRRCTRQTPASPASQQAARDVAGENRHRGRSDDRGDRRDRRHEERHGNEQRGRHRCGQPRHRADEQAEQTMRRTSPTGCRVEHHLEREEDVVHWVLLGTAQTQA